MSSEPARTRKTLPCPKCGNRLRVLPDQVGTEIMCPKCSAAFTVGRPSTPGGGAGSTVPSGAPRSLGGQPPAAPPDDDSYEPEIPLTPSSIGKPVNSSAPSEIEQHWGYAPWTSEPPKPPRATAEPTPADGEEYFIYAASKGLIRHEVETEPPRWTFFSGVFDFPWRGLNLTRWTAMSIALSLTGILAFYAAGFLGIGRQGMGGLALMGIPLILMTSFSAVVTLSFVTVCFLGALQDTADGHREVQDSLPELGQWIFSLLSVMMLASLSAAIGYPLSLIEPIGIFGPVVSWLVLFPIVLSSALEADSFLLPVSAPILNSLVRCWWGWAVFYGLTLPLAILAVAGLAWGISVSPMAALMLAGPVFAALALIYARLLGRLIWRASGLAPSPRGQTVQGSTKRTARRGRKAHMPEGLEEAAGMFRDDRPAGSPPVNPRRP